MDTRQLPRPELLAPAGNADKLRTALHFGADAVYLGLKAHSLRAYAGNFTPDELEWAIGYAHGLGRKVHVAVNVQAMDPDLNRISSTLELVGRLGPDAVIISDPGVLRLARLQCKGVPLHLSTQQSVTNSEAARFWFSQGISRIIAARELGLEEFRAMALAAPGEFEIFIHGAVCVAWSGRCFLSLYWAGRDPRKGACAQGCRWPYRVGIIDGRRPEEVNPVEEDERGTYFFDAKDLCALPLLEQVVRSGACSLKIEGRTRSEHYVAVVSDVYCHALDLLEAQGPEVLGSALPELMKELHRPTNRGFSTHFLDGRQNDPDSYNPEGSYQGSRNDYLGKVVAIRPGRAIVELKNKVIEGERVQLRDRGMIAVDARLDRIELEDGSLCDFGRPGQRIQVPCCGVGIEALMRRQGGELD